MSKILNEPDRVAFEGALGNDIIWGQYGQWGEATAEDREAFDAAFESLGDGHHTDGDTYQGTTFMAVVKRKADGKLFGFDYWEGGGKYGERYVDEGSTSDHDLNVYDDDFETVEQWRVFLPVEEHAIPAFRFIKKEN